MREKGFSWGPKADNIPPMEQLEDLNQLHELFHSSDWPEAESWLLKSLESASDKSLLYYNLGLVYKRMDRTLDALEAFERAAEIRPEEPLIWNEIGLIYDEAGRVSKAEDFYQKAVNADRNFAPAWNNLGVMAFVKGDFAEAQLRFSKATQLDSGIENAWINLADTCRELGDLEGEKRARAQLSRK